MARLDASELAIRLGRQAEAVCRHYLSAGHREGRYWLVGGLVTVLCRSPISLCHLGFKRERADAAQI